MGSRRKKPSGSAPAKVMLVDDHPLWLETLRKVLDRYEQIRVVDEVETGEDAVRVSAASPPDIVVMDIDLPGMSGIEATAALVGGSGMVQVLMLSASSDPDLIIRSIRAGASGYLVKTAGAREVADAIVRVHAGDLVLPADIAPAVLDRLRRGEEDGSGLDALTDGEREVLDLMSAGRTNQAIAEKLHLSIKTVEARVTSIYTKLTLEPTAADHRRVLAVVRYLEESGGPAGS